MTFLLFDSSLFPFVLNRRRSIEIMDLKNNSLGGELPSELLALQNLNTCDLGESIKFCGLERCDDQAGLTSTYFYCLTVTVNNQFSGGIAPDVCTI